MNFKSHTNLINSALDSVSPEEIDDLIHLLMESYKSKRLVFVIGNGGSAANASHFAQDLAKGTRTHADQPLRLRALSLTDNTPFITAQANDEGYNTIFEQQLRTFAAPGDLVIAISGSGNSPNIIEAVEWANKNELITVGVTGFDGGKLKKISQHNLHVPLNDMCTSESIHTIIFHYVILELRERLKELNNFK